MTVAIGHQIECIFCKIGSGVIPAKKLYEDEDFFCIRDIQPQAKVHLLVVPKLHVKSLEQLYDQKNKTLNGNLAGLLEKMFKVALEVVGQNGLLPGGFRSIINTGKDGGQTIAHLHLHLLGGEKLRESL